MAGKLVIDTLEDGSGNEVPVTTVVQGSAKAWVNFNGTGTVAISDDFNVSSITDNTTGDYTINFDSAMANANYAAVGSCRAIDTNSYVVNISDLTAPTTSALRIKTESQSSTATDTTFVCVAVFGD